MAAEPRIVIDCRPFDRPSAAGQSRYARDLVRGLAHLAPPARFGLLLSQSPDRFDVPEGWHAHVLPVGHGRGAHLANRIRTGLHLRLAGRDLMHGIHTLAPWPRAPHQVFTVHDLMVDRFPEYETVRTSRAYRQYRRAVTHADRVIAISRATANDLASLWDVPRERIVVVPLAQDAGTWAVGRQEDSEPTILSHYNLEPRKNLAGLIDALALLRAERPDVRLILFGRGAVTPDRERAFDERLTTAGVTEAVTRTGVLSDTELAKWYARAHVLAFPSLYEGYGLPMIEAMHAGLPVVAHPSPAAREVLGEAGTLADATNPSAFATALRALLGNPARRAQLSARGQARARARNTIDVARETWATYAAVLEGTR